MKNLLWLFPLFLLSSCSLQLNTHRYTGGFHLSGGRSSAPKQSVAQFRLKPIALRPLSAVNTPEKEFAAQKTVYLKHEKRQSGLTATLPVVSHKGPIRGFANPPAHISPGKLLRKSPLHKSVIAASGKQTEPMAPISMVVGIAGVIMLFNEPLVAFGFLALLIGSILALISVSRHNKEPDRFWTKNLAMAALYLNGIALALCVLMLLLFLEALNSL